MPNCWLTLTLSLTDAPTACSSRTRDANNLKYKNLHILNLQFLYKQRNIHRYGNPLLCLVFCSRLQLFHFKTNGVPHHSIIKIINWLRWISEILLKLFLLQERGILKENIQEKAIVFQKKCMLNLRHDILEMTLEQMEETENTILL